MHTLTRWPRNSRSRNLCHCSRSPNRYRERIFDPTRTHLSFRRPKSVSSGIDRSCRSPELSPIEPRLQEGGPKSGIKMVRTGATQLTYEVVRCGTALPSVVDRLLQWWRKTRQHLNRSRVMLLQIRRKKHQAKLYSAWRVRWPGESHAQTRSF